MAPTGPNKCSGDKIFSLRLTHNQTDIGTKMAKKKLSNTPCLGLFGKIKGKAIPFTDIFCRIETNKDNKDNKENKLEIKISLL